MVNDWNKRVIEEFRENKGRVASFGPAPLLLLTTIGRKSGQPRTAPVMYRKEGDTLYVFASKAGSPTHPAWFHNLEANPLVQVEVGEESYRAKAEVLPPDERDRIYAQQAQEYPQFGEYQEKTSRRIPVVALRRLDTV